MFKKIVNICGADMLAILLFLTISIAYFFTPISEGKILGGHDTKASVGLGHEQIDYHQKTGDYTRWVNNVFCGMPTYQIAPSYKSDNPIKFLSKIYGMGTTGAVGYLFIFLLGFYILLRAFNFRPYLAALGAVLWAFSSYFLIIMAAGHIWKVVTLCYIPPTIAGLVLCYRKKWLWGISATALFAALQIHANHFQMTYYFCFLIAIVIITYGLYAFYRQKNNLNIGITLTDWWKGTLAFVLAGLLGLMVNLPNIYHTYSYAQQSMRGPAELTPTEGKADNATKDGLDKSYITQWSYGIGETMTLLIPDFKGGGSEFIGKLPGVDKLDSYNQLMQQGSNFQQIMAQQGQRVTPPGFNAYWGDQPFTVGPVYVGSIVCLLFILGFFLVRGPMPWALMIATLLSFAFAWGHNFPAFTNFCIDHLPLYSKFRTPSSALVIAEFTMPLLAILGLKEILLHPSSLLKTKHGRIGLTISLTLTVGVCLILWLFPSISGDCLSDTDKQIFGMLASGGLTQLTQPYSTAITELHHDIISASALRSLSFLSIAIALIGFYIYRGKQKSNKAKSILCITLLAVCLTDLWGIDKRYLNDNNFTDPEIVKNLTPNPADQIILQDKSDYRVLDLSQGSPFNETSNHSPYFHQSLGGYHAAKLHRYQDLISLCLNPQIINCSQAAAKENGNMTKVNMDSIGSVINMLNTKYFIFAPQAEGVVYNPYANGNGWFVNKLVSAKNADEEMAKLKHIDTKHTAIVNEEFAATLEGTKLDSGKVILLKRKPNHLSYMMQTQKGGIAVLSEIYYPGWTATIDGKPASIARVNYVLRALKIPAGRHKVELYYEPQSVKYTETIAYAASTLIFLFLLIASWKSIKNIRKDEIIEKEK